MRGNHFYTNPEAYAMEFLQQKMLKEAQASVQQTLMELSALRSFLSQGQLLYCIPFGGMGSSRTSFGAPPANPFTDFMGQNFNPVYMPSLQPTNFPPNPLPVPPQYQFLQSSPPAPSHPPAPHFPQNAPQPQRQVYHPQSVVKVNLKNGQNKTTSFKPDEFNIGNDGIEISIDLREYLPAEILLDVDEKYVEIKAIHNEAHGRKTFARRYDLPACIILDSVRTILTHDGFLLFSAVWCRMDC